MDFNIQKFPCIALYNTQPTANTADVCFFMLHVNVVFSLVEIITARQP